MVLNAVRLGPGECGFREAAIRMVLVTCAMNSRYGVKHLQLYALTEFLTIRPGFREIESI